jgi:2'-hydroxyisoflavone reductase
VWISETDLQAHGVEPFTQIPCWVPEAGEFAGLLEANTSRAARTGLVCRPVTATVTDTWQWIKQEGMPAQRLDRDVHGLPAALEQQILAAQQ